jgi:hypothetical protein
MTLTLICGSVLPSADADLMLFIYLFKSAFITRCMYVNTKTRTGGFQSKEQVQIEKKNSTEQLTRWERGNQQLSEVPHIFFMPDRNGDRAIGELSRRNELCNAFLDRFRWLEPL